MKLNPTQQAALYRLSDNPAAYIPAGTLAFLRRNGLVGKVVTKVAGRQKTTSPVTAEGRALLPMQGRGAA